VVKVRLDRRATAISLLIALGVRRDGQKVVLAIQNEVGDLVLAHPGSKPLFTPAATRAVGSPLP
jgi:hypothetical protein